MSSGRGREERVAVLFWSPFKVQQAGTAGRRGVLQTAFVELVGVPLFRQFNNIPHFDEKGGPINFLPRDGHLAVRDQFGRPQEWKAPN